MKTLALLILFAGLCAFVSAEEDYNIDTEEFDEESEEDYNFDTEEFDDEYEDALGLKRPRPRPGKLLEKVKKLLGKLCSKDKPPALCKRIGKCKKNKMAALKCLMKIICKKYPKKKICKRPRPTGRPHPSGPHPSGRPHPSRRPRPSGRPHPSRRPHPSGRPSGRPHPSETEPPTAM
ncbi:Hypothetical predicted protein [Paramuricea clavata]|uniref:Uncharacterized protein n=1 Tax=Paramuricea clavata TaxID=317549 RepID=A0A7D9EI12_PARCT|nr:Hypothetical predicted protein [Paramuricea clavata]